ncbi:aldolase/citrate lyase family protein [Rossellomorea sp. NRS-1567]|uniref:aldolase/citrate lyase family protein n=1 Tax=Rossellomorea sp. NRS-1567 TaxID=3233901 RepID=UPI003D275150
MKLMLISNNPLLVEDAERAGVDRIFIDLEKNGKQERQGHLDTHVSTHELQDVCLIRKVVSKSELLVRVNPIHQGSEEEINDVITSGADVVMLPMFKTPEEVAEFVTIVNNRAKVCLLLETAEALIRIKDILSIEDIDEIHVGLNDLHLGLGLDFMFEILSSFVIDELAKTIQDKGIRFGFGGIAKIGEGDLPAELILNEHARLNSEMVILSRGFLKERDKGHSRYYDLSLEVEKIRNHYKSALKRSSSDIQNDKIELDKKIKVIAMRKRESNYVFNS